MSSRTIEFVVYLVGVCLLGAAHGVMNRLLSGPAHLATAVGYLIGIRLLGKYLAKRFASSKATPDSEA